MDVMLNFLDIWNVQFLLSDFLDFWDKSDESFDIENVETIMAFKPETFKTCESQNADSSDK